MYDIKFLSTAVQEHAFILMYLLVGCFELFPSFPDLFCMISVPELIFAALSKLLHANFFFTIQFYAVLHVFNIYISFMLYFYI